MPGQWYSQLHGDRRSCARDCSRPCPVCLFIYLFICVLFHILKKTVNVSECFPEFCEPFKQTSKPKEVLLWPSDLYWVNQKYRWLCGIHDCLRRAGEGRTGLWDWALHCGVCTNCSQWQSELNHRTPTGVTKNCLIVGGKRPTQLTEVKWRDFPGGPVVETLLQCRGVQVWCLLEELRSHMPRGQKTKTWNKNSIITNSF